MKKKKKSCQIKRLLRSSFDSVKEAISEFINHAKKNQIKW